MESLPFVSSPKDRITESGRQYGEEAIDLGGEVVEVRRDPQATQTGRGDDPFGFEEPVECLCRVAGMLTADK